MTSHDLEPLAELIAKQLQEVKRLGSQMGALFELTREISVYDLIAKQLQELKRLGAQTGPLFELTREISVYAVIGSASLMPQTEPAPMLVALEEVVTICDGAEAAAETDVDACHDTIRNLRRIASYAIAEQTKRPR